MPISSEQRILIARDNDWKCFYCDDDLGGLPTVDHQLPVSRGGSDDISNLVACCRSCNSSKGAMTAEEYAFSLWFATRMGGVHKDLAHAANRGAENEYETAILSPEEVQMLNDICDRILVSDRPREFNKQKRAAGKSMVDPPESTLEYSWRIGIPLGGVQ